MEVQQWRLLYWNQYEKWTKTLRPGADVNTPTVVGKVGEHVPRWWRAPTVCITQQNLGSVTNVLDFSFPAATKINKC